MADMTKITSFSLDILLANCYNNKIIIKCPAVSVMPETVSEKMSLREGEAGLSLFI